MSLSDLFASCFGSSTQSQNRPLLTPQQASNLSLEEFITRSLTSSPSIQNNKNAFSQIYSNLLFQNNPDPGTLARQVENVLSNLSSNNTEHATNSWAIQLIGMAIDNSRNQQSGNTNNFNQQHGNTNNAAWSQVAGSSYAPPQTPNTAPNTSKVYIRPYFFPSEASFSALLKEITKAKSSLDICVYSITDDDISNRLIDLHNSGVRVRIISDDDQAKGRGSDLYDFRDKHGMQVRFDNMASYMHNKFCVIDNKVVITGSYNWSKNARKNNQENIIITNSTEATNGFTKEFEKLWAQFSRQ
ncbi:hypothetical protein BB559_001787 [Furculomyces boomerangus]|uniref:Mitochondrial cardiolipin hydrolase n=2 Tax=Harpellales TaxID=61421 RepID=A0A2T9Z0I0_9FUNG|nr:hypothetical protein BB559_001787 [Furculomyces boomerangus]PWA02908.1 hypothetical protein BB558_000946 [Smittium angustum]